MQVADADDCDVDGGDGNDYWCPETDTCCRHPADNGNDGDWVCCDADQAPYVCAKTADDCTDYDGSCDDYADDGNGIVNWCPGTQSDQKCCFHPADTGRDGDWFCCDTDATCAQDEWACDA